MRTSSFGVLYYLLLGEIDLVLLSHISLERHLTTGLVMILKKTAL